MAEPITPLHNRQDDELNPARRSQPHLRAVRDGDTAEDFAPQQPAETNEPGLASRPALHAIKGGGDTSAPTGNLAAVKDNKPGGGLSEDELSNRESNPDSTSPASRLRSSDRASNSHNPLAKEPTVKESTGNFVKKPLKSAGNSRKKIALALGVGGSASLITGAMFLMSFLGQLKTFHIEAVSRFAAFAQFRHDIGRVNAQVTFDAAVLTKDSTGSLALGDRSLVQKLRRVNPEKRLAELGREGTLKFDITSESRWGGLQTRNTFNGVEISGKAYKLDAYAKDLFGEGKTYNNLSKRQRWTVESRFVNDVRLGLAERLSTENLSFRSSVYNGLRQAAGIRMTKWLDWKKYVGKTPKEAARANIEETVKTITGEDLTAKTGAASVSDDEVKAYQDEVIDAAAEGRPTSDITPKSKLMGKVKLMNDASDVAFLLTVACIGHDVKMALQEAGKRTETNALGMGHNLLTAADQGRTGNTSSEAMNSESTTWNGADSAALYHQDTGQELTNADMGQIAEIPPILPSPYMQATTQAIEGMLDTAFGAGSPAGPMILRLVGLGGVVDETRTLGCRAVLNEYVQGTITFVEIAAALASLGAEKTISAAVVKGLKLTVQGAAGYETSILLSKQLDNLIKTYAGMDYTGAVTGRDKYNQTRMGMGYLAEVATRRITYGRPVSPGEYADSQRAAMAELRDSYKSKPLHERYFAITNPFSLTGQIIGRTPTSMMAISTSLTRSVGSAVASILNPLQLTGGVGKALTAKTYAAPGPMITGSTVGLTESGWTREELDKIENDDKFQSENLEQFMESNYERLEEMYRPCYSYYLQSERPTDIQQAKLCSADKEEGLASPDAVKWRWYNALLDNAGESGRSLQEIASEVPTEQINAPSSTSAIAKFSSTDTMACPAGTKEIGIANSRYTDTSHTDSPGSLRIKLCQLSSIDGSGDGPDGNTLSGGAVLNALVADRFQSMGEAYQTEKGSKLVAGSSFRLEDSCGGGGDGNQCARPGASSHQLGVAVDFSGTHVGKPSASTSCTIRATDSSSPVWTWLSENADKFGIKQYSAESWHWDVMAMVNRC